MGELMHTCTKITLNELRRTLEKYEYAKIKYRQKLDAMSTHRCTNGRDKMYFFTAGLAANWRRIALRELENVHHYENLILEYVKGE